MRGEDRVVGTALAGRPTREDRSDHSCHDGNPPAPGAVAQGFDYSTIGDAAVADEARHTADRIRRRTHAAYFENGRDLIAIKAKLGHGPFGCWLRAEFDMSERTAQNLMSAAELLDSNSANFSVLPATAIYRLAAPSTPQAVRDEISDRLAHGQIISVKQVTYAIALGRQREAAAQKEQKRLERLSPDGQRRLKRTKERRKIEQDRAAEELRQAQAIADGAAQSAADLLVERLGDELAEFIDTANRAGWSNIRSRLLAMRT